MAHKGLSVSVNPIRAVNVGRLAMCLRQGHSLEWVEITEGSKRLHHHYFGTLPSLPTPGYGRPFRISAVSAVAVGGEHE